MSVAVETEYSRFQADRAKAMEWLMDAMIADGIIAYERRGDLHRIKVDTVNKPDTNDRSTPTHD